MKPSPSPWSSMHEDQRLGRAVTVDDRNARLPRHSSRRLAGSASPADTHSRTPASAMRGREALVQQVAIQRRHAEEHRRALRLARVAATLVRGRPLRIEDHRRAELQAREQAVGLRVGEEQLGAREQAVVGAQCRGLRARRARSRSAKRCACTTALGLPEVPDEWHQKAGASRVHRRRRDRRRGHRLRAAIRRAAARARATATACRRRDSARMTPKPASSRMYCHSAGGNARVDRDRDAAGPDRAEEGDDPVAAVGQLDRHAVAGATPRVCAARAAARATRSRSSP